MRFTHVPARGSYVDGVGVIEGEIQFNTPGAATGAVIGTVPAGSMIIAVVVNIREAFDAGTTNVLTVGHPGAAAAFATVTDPESAGGEFIADEAGTRLAAETDVTVTYTQTGTPATEGDAAVLVLYATR